MQTEKKSQTRKKFLLGSLGLAGLFGSVKLFFGKKKEQEQKQTMKMLTEDGRLVEVDIDRVKKIGQKISNEEIHHWIKNKPTL